MKKLCLLLSVLFVPALLCAQSRDQTQVGETVSASVARASSPNHTCTADNSQRSYDCVAGHTDAEFEAADWMNDKMHTFNMVTVTARHADGTVFYSHTSHNLKTTGGIDCIASQLANTSTQCAAGNYIALSSTLSSPTAGDCAGGSSTCTLTGEISTNGLSRHIATYAHTSSTSTYTLAYTWTATGTVAAVTGAAVFNASSSGTSIFENTFPSVALNSGDQITVTWTITIS